MRKAKFIILDNKKDFQVSFDKSLTPQQRVDRMFDLISSLMYFQKEYKPLSKSNAISLKRRNGSVS